MLYFTYVPHIVIAGLWKIYDVSSNNTKWEYEWTSTRRPVSNPVTGRRTSTVRPVTAWIAMRKDVTGKEITLTSWKTEIAKCRRTRTTWTLCKRRTGKAIPWAAKEHIVLIETCEPGNNHRNAIVGQNLAAKRSVMKRNFSRPTWDNFLEFGINLWPWNYWKVQNGHFTVQKDLGLLNSGMLNRGEVLCITVAVDQSTVKIGGNDKKLQFKIKWDCLIAVRWIKEGTFA